MHIPYMDNVKQKYWNFAVVLLFLIGIFLLFRSSSFSSPFLIQKSSSSSVGTNNTIDSVLAKASMENKTVVVTFINKAYAEQDVNGDTSMFDLFLSSFWLGEGTRSLVDHLLVVTVDQTADDRCRFLRLNCFKLETDDDGVDFGGEKVFMSADFIKMMWRRTLFLLQVLKRGYNFIFTDADVMWLRNPFTRLSNDTNEDLQISTDRYLGDPRSKRHDINTGFYFVRSNNKTTSLFETWYSKKENSTGQKEQDVLQDLIRHGITKHLGVRVRFMDTVYFSGFCQNSKDFRAVTTVHANCCRSITAKITDLKAVLRDWKQFKMFKASKSNLTNTVEWSDHHECGKSWS